MFSFIHLGLLDIIDIAIVAYLFYKLYQVSRGTTAMTLIIGVAILYATWLLVRTLRMELTATIMGQVMGVGIIALIIVFQQELRHFLLYLGNQYVNHRKFSLRRFLDSTAQTQIREEITHIVDAAQQMASTKTGALIVIVRVSPLQDIRKTGTPIDATINSRLIQNIFFKNSPLHDGATIIDRHRIAAAQCILPVSDGKNIPKRLGLRHRAAIGVTEVSDALVIVVSEETGRISLVENGKIREGLAPKDLEKALSTKLKQKIDQ